MTKSLISVRAPPDIRSQREASPEEPPSRGLGTVRRVPPGGFYGEGRSLLVPRGIALKGRIGSCEELIVEGSLETELAEVRELVVAHSGRFSGAVEVDAADIAGAVEGPLTVHEHLIVRAGARIAGDVACGVLTVERGATIVGRIRASSDDGEDDGGARPPEPARSDRY